MTRSEEATRLFEAGYNCAQSVLCACVDDENLTHEAALGVAAALGGGMCRTAGPCGAVTGALMAIGSRYSSRIVEDPSYRKVVYAKGAEFIEKFKSKHGSTICRELLGCDISTTEGTHYALERDLTKIRCVQFIADAVESVGLDKE
ncbi:MAG: C-GCAxxG-C-C family protein [Capsulimonadaceae bacterium]|nr:C-GCAxxG-C-C family protein [Capsulimonadaceae bacterium]